VVTSNFKIMEYFKKENVWRDAVENILLQILEELPYTSILSAGLVCRRWQRLSLDELLWKAVLTKHFNIAPPVTLKHGAVSWRKEFIRMMDDIPCVETQIIEYHTDEVVHVAYAHSREMFSVCSKDSRMSVWKASHPCRLLAVLYAESYWKTPCTAKFNYSDSMLMVNWMLEDFSVEGADAVIAIYKVEENESFSLIKVVLNSSYDKIDQGWVTDTSFLACNMGIHSTIVNSMNINDYEVIGQELTKLYDIDEDLYSRCINTIGTETTGENGIPDLLFSCGNSSQENEEWSMAPTRMGLVGKSENPSKVRYDAKDVKLFSPSTPNTPHMYISGFSLDPEEKVCYINVRPLTPNQQKPGLFDASENLQLLPLDISTMTAGRPLTGHKGFSIVEADPFALYCIYPDVTRDYVCCGSEDNLGYIWDRHYGCLVGQVSGHTKPVCGVAMDPARQDVMVTVSDDHQIRIFRTKKWKRENLS